MTIKHNLGNCFFYKWVPCTIKYLRKLLISVHFIFNTTYFASDDSPKSFICHLNDRKVRRRRAGISKECTLVGDFNSFRPYLTRPVSRKLNTCAVPVAHSNIPNTYLSEIIYICCGICISLPLGIRSGLFIFLSRSRDSCTGGRRCRACLC